MSYYRNWVLQHERDGIFHAKKDENDLLKLITFDTLELAEQFKESNSPRFDRFKILNLNDRDVRDLERILNHNSD